MYYVLRTTYYYLLTTHHFPLTTQVRTVALPPIRVKGRDEPMAVYRPQKAQATSAHRTAPGGVQGRKAEQRRLQARVEAVSKGEGGFVLVEGEAGMGKTALLRDLQP